MILLLVCLLAISINNIQAQKLKPVDYVNTLMGANSEYDFSNGNTYPAIARPWGMNFWTLQTGKMGDGWVYSYNAHIRYRGSNKPINPARGSMIMDNSRFSR